MGIKDYYQNLSHGDKDKFVIEVAEAIGQSTSSVRRKLRDESWRMLERQAVEKLIG